jgi:hypothetical protein
LLSNSSLLHSNANHRATSGQKHAGRYAYCQIGELFLPAFHSFNATVMLILGLPWRCFIAFAMVFLLP